MKLFGYQEGNDQQGKPMSLSETSILVTPSELRAIAKIFDELATEMESESFGHVHLSDRLRSAAEGADLIIVKA